MTAPRFTLPTEPVDGFVLEAWRADTLKGVRCLRYVYRSKCTWGDLYPEEVGAGADFENEWQIFHDENFVGRYDTWLGPLTWLNEQPNVFASRREAQEQAVQWLRERIRYMLQDIKSWRALLAKIEGELTAPSPGTTR